MQKILSVPHFEMLTEVKILLCSLIKDKLLNIQKNKSVI